GRRVHAVLGGRRGRRRERALADQPHRAAVGGAARARRAAGERAGHRGLPERAVPLPRLLGPLLPGLAPPHDPGLRRLRLLAAGPARPDRRAHRLPDRLTPLRRAGYGWPPTRDRHAGGRRTRRDAPGYGTIIGIEKNTASATPIATSRPATSQ